MFILGVIPARGGSKRIPRKNIKLMAGKPLIACSILEAQKSKLNDVVVSTDDKNISIISEHYDCTVINRPDELAQDTSPTPPVILHAVREYEQLTGIHVNAVMTLQVTSPLRTYVDINNAIEVFENNDSLISVIEVFENNDSLISVMEGVHPVKSYDHNGKPFFESELLDRSKHKKCYTRNGAIFITRRDLLETGRLMGDSPIFYEMPKSRSLDVDDEDDFMMVEAILKHQRSVQNNGNCAN